MAKFEQLHGEAPIVKCPKCKSTEVHALVQIWAEPTGPSTWRTDVHGNHRVRYDFSDEAVCGQCCHRAPLGEFALEACRSFAMMAPTMGAVELADALEGIRDLVHDTANELVKLEHDPEGEGASELGRKLKLLGAVLDDQKM